MPFDEETAPKTKRRSHRSMAVSIRMQAPDDPTPQDKLHRIARAFRAGRRGLAPPVEIVSTSRDSRRVYRISEAGQVTDFPLSPADRERLHDIERDIP
jgi:hypothetical protein